MAKARAEELRAAEADAWKKPASSTEPPSSAKPSGSAREGGAQREPVDEQPQPQPDLGDSEMAMSTETPDAETIRRRRIVAKRSDPGELKEEVPKRLRIVTKHSRPLWMATDTVSGQPEKRARLPEDHAEVNPETFGMTLESRGTMETYTELNVAASDLHESDPE